MNLNLFDIVGILGGIALIVAPEWAYNLGRQEKKEITPKWKLICRICGVAFVLIGLAFLYFGSVI